VEPHVGPAVEDPADQVEPRFAAAIVDVFVYVVVLNLFVEYVPQVISETFTLSLLTAVLLKGVLEIVVVAKNRVKARFRAASTPIGKVVAAVMLWAVLFGSKFLVLEVVALVFSDRVSLGGFFSVTALILALLLSRAGIRRLLRRPYSAHKARPEKPLRRRHRGCRGNSVAVLGPVTRASRLAACLPSAPRRAGLPRPEPDGDAVWSWLSPCIPCPRLLLVGGAVDRLADHVGDGLRLGNHDHVGSFDLGDCRSGALSHGTDDVAARGLVAGGYDGP